MTPKTKPYKAVVAGVVAAGGALTLALNDGVLSATEIITGIVTVVVAVGAVYGVSNPPS